MGKLLVDVAFRECSFELLEDVVSNQHLRCGNIRHGSQQANIQREGLVFVNGNTKKRAGNSHIILRKVFLKVFEAAQSSDTFLDFIDDNKRILGDDINPSMGRQCADNSLDVMVWLKDRFSHGILVQVDVGGAFIFLSTELF